MKRDRSAVIAALAILMGIPLIANAGKATNNQSQVDSYQAQLDKVWPDNRNPSLTELHKVVVEFDAYMDRDPHQGDLKVLPDAQFSLGTISTNGYITAETNFVVNIAGTLVVDAFVNSDDGYHEELMLELKCVRSPPGTHLETRK